MKLSAATFLLGASSVGAASLEDGGTAQFTTSQGTLVTLTRSGDVLTADQGATVECQRNFAIGTAAHFYDNHDGSVFPVDTVESGTSMGFSCAPRKDGVLLGKSSAASNNNLDFDGSGVQVVVQGTCDSAAAGKEPTLSFTVNNGAYAATSKHYQPVISAQKQYQCIQGASHTVSTCLLYTSDAADE